MGIYDRDYVFKQQRGRTLSMTAWIIIINAAVFVGDWVISHGLKFGLPMRRSDVSFVEGKSLDTLAAEHKLTYIPDYAVMRPVADATGSIVPGWEVASREQVRTPGMMIYRPVFMNANDPPVGAIAYTVRPPFEALGHFSTYQAIRRLEVWRLITFQFLHANLLHIAFNMFGLWIFGRIVEEQLGRSRYLAYYLICGIFGALAYLLLNAIGVIAAKSGVSHVPFLMVNDMYTPLVGASAGVFGVIMACAYISPNSVVQLLFPPIPMKMRTFAYSYVLLAILMVIFGAKNAGGEMAHIGGAVAGYFFIRRQHLLRDFFAEFRGLGRFFKRTPKNSNLKLVGTTGEPAGDPLGPELRAELDRILEKSHRDGPQSLSPTEQATLRDATEKLNRARR